MATELRFPFHSLSGDRFISRGSGGHIFAISKNIVLKCPTLFLNPAPPQQEEMEESIQKIEHEKQIYTDILMRYQHPNIVHGIICTPEGLFMQRLDTTLEARLSSRTVNANTQIRWICQLASAMAWLESVGYVHGDLRPANILLDQMENIKVADFDAAVKRGQELVVASEPFCKMDQDFESPPAGPLTEQLSLASCMYNIRFGHTPWHELDAPRRVQKLIKGEFPSTSSDDLFGKIISGCWRGHYDSIRAVESDIVVQSSQISGLEQEGLMSGRIGHVMSWWLLSECKSWLAKERPPAASLLQSGQRTLEYWSQRSMHMVLGVWLSGRHLWDMFILRWRSFR